MKHLAGLVCLVFLTGFVSAHAGDHSDLPEPGTTPGSAFFGLEQAQESISLALTFNKENKAHKRLHLARERLSEARELANNNNSQSAEKAVQMYSQAMQSAENSIQDLSEDRRNNASQELNNTRNHSISVLEDLKQKLPEEAMNGINTAIQAQKQGGIGNSNQTDRPGGGPQVPDQNNTSSTPGVGNEGGRAGGYVATGRVIRSSR